MSDMQFNKAKARKKPDEGEPSEVPVYTDAGWKALDRRLPENMVVTIDGPARTGKNTVGELLALAIGGVVIDSGRFYRSLTQAALMAVYFLLSLWGIVSWTQRDRENSRQPR